MKKSYIISLITTIVITTLCILYGFCILIPTKMSTDAKAQEAYKQTMEHLQHIASKAHPTNSQEIEEVREYLEEQFTRMDVSYERMDFTRGANRLTDYLVCLDVPNTDKGVVFVSHYDSVRSAPGACDDGICVASMLTVLQEMKERKNTNDVYFLFTDGEELGLQGAKSFLENYHEIYRDKFQLVVNLEGRGNKGTVLMFEASDGDYQIARMLQKAVKSGSVPFSSSSDVYKRMPNDTDLTVFLQNGYAGINFAAVNGAESYHKDTDSIEYLRPDVAYMYYTTVSELADYLGKSDLSEMHSSEKGVYFPVARGGFLLLSRAWMDVIIALTILMFPIVCIFLIVKKKMKWKKIGLTLITFFATAAAGIVVILISNTIFRKMYNQLQVNIRVGNAKKTLYLIQMILITIAAILIFHFLRTKQEHLTEHIVFYGILFWICSLGIFFYLRGATYLFAIPLIFITAIGGLELCKRRDRVYAWQKLLAILLCLSCSMIFIPSVCTMYQSILFTSRVNLAGMVLGAMEIPVLGTCIGILLYTNKKETS